VESVQSHSLKRMGKCKRNLRNTKLQKPYGGGGRGGKKEERKKKRTGLGGWNPQVKGEKGKGQNRVTRADRWDVEREEKRGGGV